MTRDQKKLALAITFLSLALFVLGFQLFRRLSGPSPGASVSAAPAAMMDDGKIVEVRPETIYWAEPEDGLRAALSPSPFLTSGSAAPRRAPTGRGKTTTAPPAGAGLTVRGFRTGESRAAIINDRVVREGESIAGWRVLSVDAGRVTLRNSDGKTIRLAAK